MYNHEVYIDQSKSTLLFVDNGSTGQKAYNSSVTFDDISSDLYVYYEADEQQD